MNKIELLKAVANMDLSDTNGLAALKFKCERELATELFAAESGKTSDKALVNNIVKMLDKLQAGYARFGRILHDMDGRQAICYKGEFLAVYDRKLPVESLSVTPASITPKSVSDIMKGWGVDADKTATITKGNVKYYKAMKQEYISVHGTILKVQLLEQLLNVTENELTLKVNSKNVLSTASFLGKECKGVICPVRAGENWEKPIEHTQITA